MSENQLPAVAKSIFTDCKKCGAEKYHIVLAHSTPTSAKVKCEICGAKKTYKLPKVAGAKKTASGAPKAPSKRGAAAAAARKTAHAEEYHKLIEASKHEATNYNMKTLFEAQAIVKHPKFGLGFVKSAFPDKIEVMFEDEIRSLVHGRN